MRALRFIGITTAALLFIAASSSFAFAQGKSSSDVLTPQQVKELAGTAKTPADHMKLSRHFAALAAQYEAQAADHDALAKVYRTGPNASETKRPGAPDTALHCERLAANVRAAAKDARDLAAAHERMAADAK